MKSPFRFFGSAIDLLFPLTCCGCGDDIPSGGALFCIYCQAQMPLTGFETHPGNPVEKIFWGRAEIEEASAHLYFTSGSAVQQSLHLLKYKGRKEIGIYFGQQMGKALLMSMRFRHCEIIIPLPLSSTRQKKRGYNQATEIACGISYQLGIPVIGDAVIRIKKTKTQTHKNRIDRWRNMAESFEIANQEKIRGKHILLVDDVVTTGASLEACSLALSGVPGIKISVACLAHTVSA